MLHRLCKAGNCSEVEAYLTVAQERDEAKLIQIANSKNEQKYTPLHSAIFSRNLELVKLLIRFGADVNTKCCGTPALHLALFSAMLPNGKDFGLQCFDTLLQNSANILLKDENGFTPLHLAAEFNLHSLIPTIVEAAKPELIVNVVYRITGLSALHRAAYSDAEESITSLLNCGADLSQGDVYGMTALHVAGYFACVKAWKALVLRGADLNGKDHSGNTPLDWLQKAGWKTTDKKHSVIARISADSTNSSVTAIVSNPLCVQHHTCPPSSVESNSAPPENIKRIQVIVDSDSGVLRSKELEDKLLWVENSREAAMSDVLRVHEWSYVRVVQQKCEAIASYDAEEEEGQGFLDGDTTICKNTFRAALAAAGAVCHAVDLVAAPAATSAVRNAFCPIRPPGHHAGPRGLVKLGGGGGPDSHGFCILNNISIGASYAMNRYRETVKKVAIVDFDVHHGNGTEETVRWLKPQVDTATVFSDFTFGQFHAPRYKPWFDLEDANNVLFVSVHGYGPRERGLPEHMLPMAAFYPGSGRTVLPDVNNAPTQIATGGENSAAAKKVKVVVSEGTTTPMEEEEEENNNNEDDSEDDDEEEDFEPGQGEEEDDEDDEGGDNSEEDDDEDEYGEESSLPPSAAVALGADEGHSGGGGGGGVLNPRVKALHRVYSTAPHTTSTSTSSFAASAAEHHEKELKPLILDVGVALPSEDPSSDPMLNIAGGKAIADLKYRVQWRRYFREEIFPRLMTFQPDMIFISAGFDAHKKDTINSGYIALVEDDFEWVTDQLVNIANSCCDGRVVSALEGGYQLGGEYSSAFAKSVKAHVASLVHGGARRAGYSQEQCDKDTDTENKFIEKLEAVREEELARREQLRQEREEQEEKRLQELREAMLLSEGAALMSSDNGNNAGGEEAVGESNGENNSKKRRRPQVDYQALDKEMREEGVSGAV